MANRDFASWESLVAAVNREARKILTEDVAPIAEEILREHITSDIYNAYTPKPGGWVGGTTYQRRYILPAATTSILEKNEDTFVLTVTSTAAPSKPVRKGYRFDNSEQGAFLKLLQSGHMGIWRGGFARPAVRNTQREIDSSPKIKNAIKSGIQSRIGTPTK